MKKKILSFGLALTMLLSCFVISSAVVSASADPIAYNEISLLDKVSVLDGDTKIGGVNSSSAEIDGEGLLTFWGTRDPKSYSASDGQDYWSRALLKLDQGIVASGYQYLFFNITFGDAVFHSSGMIRPTVSIGYAATDDGTPASMTAATVTELNANEESTGGVTYTDEADFANKTMTWAVVLPAAADTYITHIYVYPCGWPGIGNGTAYGGSETGDTDNYQITSMWLANSVISKGVGVQQTLDMDLGASTTISAASVVPGKYNSETVAQATFDGRKVWSWTYNGSGDSSGSFYVPCSVNLSLYNYVTYDIYPVDMAMPGCLPAINGDVGVTGQLQDTSYANGYALKAGEWNTVTLKLDSSKTGTVTRIQMFPTGYYRGPARTGCTKYYMGDIVFHEKKPDSYNQNQYVQYHLAENTAVTTWNDCTCSNNIDKGYNNGGVSINMKTFRAVCGTSNYPGEVILSSISVDFSRYRYVGYSFYIDDVNGDYNASEALTPAVSTGGTTCGVASEAKTYEAGVWHRVIIPIDEATNTAFNGTFGIWTLGKYKNKVYVGTPTIYVSTVSFMEKNPDAEISGEQDLRFVSVLKVDDLNKFSAVGYDISVNGYSKSIESTKVYGTVVGADIGYTPDLFGGYYFFVVRITDVPLGTTWDFTVTPFVKLADGTKIQASPIRCSVNALGALMIG